MIHSAFVLGFDQAFERRK